ncbi:MAG TPA: MurT ligase domain-containing protein, partial [Acidimicrobiales bacterium]|nr:MurT ligase domain-containing protein [Acidimicrobiales bacterium]
MLQSAPKGVGASRALDAPKAPDQGNLAPANRSAHLSLPLRTRVAAAVGGGISALSRATGRGSGSVAGGHAVLAIDPLALERLSAGRQVSLVSGTNGKTTTTKLLASALSGGDPRKVVTNLLGANLPTGLAAALAAGPAQVPAVLEVDEAWMARLAARALPSLVLLLNLSRDQLDRNNEVRQVAQRWRRACEDLSSQAVVVANADDPLVAWAAAAAPRVTWAGAGLRWKADAAGCPQCGGRVVFGPKAGTSGSSPGFPSASLEEPAPPGRGGSGQPGPGQSTAEDDWKCTSCGFSRPPLDFWLGGEASESDAVLASGESFALNLALPGRCNRANALMALAGAMSVGIDGQAAVAAMATVREVAGRYATLEVGEVRARLLLAKNPAGWAEVFDMLRPAPAPVVVAINARTADGHDPSWLWDVPFELLRGRHVVATGERGLDLAVRLHYAEVGHSREADLLSAVRSSPVRPSPVRSSPVRSSPVRSSP